jgi:hypothetical protein
MTTPGGLATRKLDSGHASEKRTRLLRPGERRRHRLIGPRNASITNDAQMIV